MRPTRDELYEQTRRANLNLQALQLELEQVRAAAVAAQRETEHLRLVRQMKDEQHLRDMGDLSAERESWKQRYLDSQQRAGYAEAHFSRLMAERDSWRQRFNDSERRAYAAEVRAGELAAQLAGGVAVTIAKGGSL